MEREQVVKGYIKLFRAIQGHWLWRDKPFSKGQAWIDMLMLANHKTKKFPFGNSLFEIERGQFLTSQAKLAIRWGWSRSKCRAFLELCKKDAMITTNVKDKQYTIVSICNYEDWQEWQTTKEPEEEPPPLQRKDNVKTSEEHQKDINNKIKNVNNGENVKENIGASDKSDLPEPVFTLLLNTKKEYPIYQTDIDAYQETYPIVNVEQEFREMKRWCIDNPKKCKTKKGIRRFINSWLSKEQDKFHRTNPPKEPLYSDVG